MLIDNKSSCCFWGKLTLSLNLIFCPFSVSVFKVPSNLFHQSKPAVQTKMWANDTTCIQFISPEPERERETDWVTTKCSLVFEARCRGRKASALGAQTTG